MRFLTNANKMGACTATGFSIAGHKVRYVLNKVQHLFNSPQSNHLNPTKFFWLNEMKQTRHYSVLFISNSVTADFFPDLSTIGARPKCFFLRCPWMWLIFDGFLPSVSSICLWSYLLSGWLVELWEPVLSFLMIVGLRVALGCSAI